MGDHLGRLARSAADNPIVSLIVGCEIGFWLLLLGGLVARYLLRRRRLSTGLLLGVPALDVVLVVATLADVARGTPPDARHGVAGLYLGFTVAFGHATITWADAWFAYWFAGGPVPPRPAREPAARVAREWREWRRLVLAWVVGAAVALLTSLVAGRGVPDLESLARDPLWSPVSRLVVVLAIWLVAGPLWTALGTLRPDRPAS